MTALAVMVALVGAMFVALQTVSAAALGPCATTSGAEANYLVVGDTCTIEVGPGHVLNADSAAGLGAVGLSDNLVKSSGGAGVTGTRDSVLDGTTYTVGAEGSGGTTAGTAPTLLTVTARAPGVVTITDTNEVAPVPPAQQTVEDDVFKIEVIDSPSIAIVFDDSDATVAAGTPVKVRLVVKGADGGEGDLPVFNAAISVPSTGLYFTSGNVNAADPQVALTGTSQRVFVDTIAAPGEANDIKFGGTAFDTAADDDNEPVLSTSGAPEGVYTVTASLPAAFGRFVANTTVTAELTVGDAGAAIGSATLALDEGEKSTVTKGGSVTLVITSFNQLDAKSNPSEVNTVTVFAPFGDISHGVYGDIVADESSLNSVQLSETDLTPTDATDANQDDVGAVTKVTVKSQGAKARSIDVYAIVIGKDGSVRTETMTLTFTGAGEGLVLGDASGTVLDRATDGDDLDMISFSLDATDGAGNAVDNPNVTITVTGPDDKNANASFARDQVDRDPDKTGDDKGKVTLTSKGTATKPLATGEYTLKVQSTTNSKVSDTATFTVVDTSKDVDVALEVDDSSPASLGSVVTITATVRDASGHPVPEKSVVNFVASDTSSSNDHVLVGANGENKQVTNTKNGVATARYFAVGEGNAVITVTTAGGANIAVIQSTATGVAPDPQPEVDEPEPEPEPEVDEPEPDPVLASASASVSVDTANVGDSVDVTITATDSADATADDSLVAAVIVTANGTLVSADAVGSQTVSVSCDEPGSIEISVRLVGTDTMVHEASASLTCLGDATAITLGDPSGSLSQIGDDSVTIEVSGATDSAGNAVDVPSDLEASVSGEGVSASVEGTTVTVSSSGSAESKVAAGDYTVTVSAGEVSAEATVTVEAEAGPPAAIELSADAEEVNAGDLLRVTAMVTDAGGDPVADGTVVGFTAGGALSLSSIATTTTNDGVASATYIVGSGAGAATVYAVAGSAAASVSVATPAVETEPEVASVDCLSNLNGFATWACGVESSASEIFGLVSGRGATAIHLWNGSAWVRYSVVDGTMVPGSSDFMVAENDILYISN